jgi:hypothetical protein
MKPIGLHGYHRRFFATDAGGTYIDKVLGYGPAVYCPQNETAGVTTTDVSGNGRDGSYTGVTLANTTGPDGVNGAPLFDGANDYVSLWQPGDGVQYMNMSEGTVAGWFKMSAAGVWTDGNFRAIVNLSDDGNNKFYIAKASANNTLQFYYRTGGTAKSRDVTYSATTWTHFALVWSKTGNYVRPYINGAQQGADLTGLGVFSGDNFVSFLLGAETTVPAFIHSGWLAHFAAWVTPQAAETIADLAVPTP